MALIAHQQFLIHRMQCSRCGLQNLSFYGLSCVSIVKSLERGPSLFHKIVTQALSLKLINLVKALIPIRGHFVQLFLSPFVQL